MSKKEPKRIKLNPDSPTTKEIKKIPLPSISSRYWDIDMNDDTFGEKDKLELNQNEDNQQDNSESI